MPPSSTIQRYRWVLLLSALIAVVPMVPLFLFASKAAAPLRLLGLAASLVLCALWLLRFARRGLPLWLEAPEALLLLLIALGGGDPMTSLGVFYTSIYFRSLYGSARRVALGACSYLAIYLIALLAAPGQSALSSPMQVLFQGIGIPACAGIMYLIAHTLARHEQALRREQILSAVSTSLAASRDRETLLDVACTALTALAKALGDVAACVQLPAQSEHDLP